MLRKCQNLRIAPVGEESPRVTKTEIRFIALGNGVLDKLFFQRKACRYRGWSRLPRVHDERQFMSSDSNSQVPSPTSACEPLPAPPLRMIAFAIFALWSGLGLTEWMEESSLSRWTGTLQTETRVIKAPFDSRIEEIAMTSGDSICQGDLLIRLNAGSLETEIAAKERELRHQRLRLSQATALADVELSWRLKEIDDDIHVTKLKSAELLKEKYASEFQNVAWTRYLTQGDGELAGSQILPFLYELPLPDEARIRAMLQQEAAHNAAEVFSAQVELCDEHLKELVSLKSSLPERVRNARGIPLIEAEIEQAQQELETLEIQFQLATLPSPTYGIVGTFRKKANQNVVAGEPIVEILDRRQQYLELVVPSRNLAFLEKGKEVILRFPGLKDKRGGVLAEIPPQAKSVSDDGESLIALKVLPAGKSWPELPFGTSIDVSIER